MTRIKTDLCVLGAGSGGLSVAAGAAQMGARVVLLEGHLMGGDCLNFGCVPSKALIAAARHAHLMGRGGRFGVRAVEPQADYGRAKDHVRHVIETIAPIDSQARFEGFGVHVIRAFGRFVSPREVVAGDFTIEARRFVVATGSRPFVPPVEGIESVQVHTNETIFDLREKPAHLIVVGGGPIGLEMAQAHRRLGCEVTVIEADRALSRDDPELVEVVRARLAAEGVRIVEGRKAERVTPEGGVTVETAGGRHTGSHLLMAVGRRPNLGFDPEAGGIAVTGQGVKVGPGLRSVTNRRVHAVGDIAGGLQFTHVAGYHAGVVVRSALFGLPARARRDHLPWATYTDPELAQVGLTEAQARRKHGNAIEIVRASFAENDRAQAEGLTEGLAKVMVHRGRPVGASIVGHGAADHVGIWALAIANGLRMSAVAGTVLPYPTMGEINKRLAGAYFGPRLFESPLVKRIVRTVQRVMP